MTEHENNGSFRKENSTGESVFLVNLNDWNKKRRPAKKNDMWYLGSIILLIGIILPISVVCKENERTWTNKQRTSATLGQYKKYAVTTISRECADIGANMLAKNGTAVDAAIAILLCEGVTSFHSMGLGGGFTMTIWNATTKTAHSLIARETASRHVKPELFNENETLSIKGGLAVAVPAEILGYWEAHQRFGKLKWNELFQPSIALCEEGFQVNKFLHEGINEVKSDIFLEPTLKKILINPVTNELYKLGERIRRPVFRETLKKLSAPDGSGVREFYNGTMAKNLIREIQAHKGILDEEDFSSYKVLWKDPIQAKLGNLTIYTSPPPASGALLVFIMNVLNGFVFEQGENVAYQRIVETFKWAFARRTELGDPDFESEVDYFVKNITSKEYAESIRNIIKNDWTSSDPKFYRAETLNPDDHGTYHTSVIDRDGSAVSVTSTINGFFGAFFRSESTGIVFNNQMNDFSFPNIINAYGIHPSPTNFIKPGKRPLSSASPTIVVDQNNDVRLIVGSVGGPKIITSIAFTMILNLWAGYNVKEAVEAYRIHHQLLPMNIQIEKGFPPSIKNYLISIGHNVTDFIGYPNFVAAITQQEEFILAYSDFRRHGKVAGF